MLTNKYYIIHKTKTKTKYVYFEYSTIHKHEIY